MSDDYLSDRRKALEESFFKKRNDELLDKMRKQITLESKRSQFRLVSGIRDARLLERFDQLNMDSETVAALALVPMIRVAWADGKLEESERAAVLRAAKDAGLEESQPSYQWLLTWLEAPPDEELVKAWTEYVVALRDTLSPEDCQELAVGLLERAREVALAAGGFLGFTNPISPEEQKILDEMKATFGG